MIRSIVLSALLSFSAFVPSILSQTPEEVLAKIYELESKLNYQQGSIPLRGNLAQLELPPEFRYLNPADAEIVLSKIWGNPPSEEPTLGMLFPANLKPTDPNGWGVIITYEEDGYVKDDDASKIDYADLMKTMQEGTREGSKERVKQGYASIDLVGWAATPRYDSTAHKMYWAKELKFAGNDENTLNYNVRILGRRGVLVLNAVAGMSQLPEIEAQTPTILSMVNFQEGNRYTDYVAGTDKVATYGIAAMVAGGVLAKGGFFKVLLASILAMKKVAIVVGIGLIVGLKSLIGRFFGKKAPSELRS